ncbi:hypothetical protein ACQP2F_14020 [Actinoplanes sp. CA-030573]|uniref:hypothetical protein n=1 Tax=Actinoplanes sp. CA-030573 TaxID=3239898 RepID=UPI003D934917
MQAALASTQPMLTRTAVQAASYWDDDDDDDEDVVGYFRTRTRCERVGRLGQWHERWDDYDCIRVSIGHFRTAWALEVATGDWNGNWDYDNWDDGWHDGDFNNISLNITTSGSASFPIWTSNAAKADGAAETKQWPRQHYFVDHQPPDCPSPFQRSRQTSACSRGTRPSPGPSSARSESANFLAGRDAGRALPCRGELAWLRRPVRFAQPLVRQRGVTAPMRG